MKGALRLIAGTVAEAALGLVLAVLLLIAIIGTVVLVPFVYRSF